MLDLFKRVWAWWNEGLTLLLAPAKWPSPTEMDYSITCPNCRENYKLERLNIYRNALQATVVCICREQLELYPDSYFGWAKPRVEWRERSYL